MKGERIIVEGLVQGVGFRPYIWQLATSLSLVGSIKNNSNGVLIDVWGQTKALKVFRSRITLRPPKLAKIEAVYHCPIAPKPVNSFQNSFQILPSEKGGVLHTQVPDDTAICAQCVNDLRDPTSRYYQFPFVSCTNCGPRFSIIQSLPYDRENTSMSSFSLCAFCQGEYSDPTSRRFHAQTIACPNCGPSIWLENTSDSLDIQSIQRKSSKTNDTLKTVASKIKQGCIVAIKSLGGFRLVCDARNKEVIQRLRKSKNRPHKPLAIMAKNVDQISQYSYVSEQEKEALLSLTNPVVLLTKKTPSILPSVLAPSQNRLGFMLPGVGLEYLLFDFFETPLVMTSANVSGQTQCYDNEDAKKTLSPLCDFILMNDREIIHQQDDSVVVLDQKSYAYRRARGVCSQLVKLPFQLEKSCSVLAMGAHKKNTFCLARDNNVYLSKFIGNLENYACYLEYVAEIQRYSQLLDFKAEHIVIDLHERYASNQHGLDLAQQLSLPVSQVQHHHAHVVAVMSEWGIPNTDKVLGVVLDGIGFGPSAELWGGELLICDYQDYAHFALLPSIALPGGGIASKEPLRNLIAHLHSAGIYQEVLERFSDTMDLSYLRSAKTSIILQMLDKQLHSPLASSAGRLFDAVAAALNLYRDAISFEGQAAMALESLCNDKTVCQDKPYTMTIASNEHQQGGLDFKVFWLELFDDIAAKVKPEIIAYKFHTSLAEAIAKKSIRLCQSEGIKTIALAGGVFQNRLLSKLLSNKIQAKGYKVITPLGIPANDGSISLGQAVVCLARLNKMKD